MHRPTDSALVSVDRTVAAKDAHRSLVVDAEVHGTAGNVPGEAEGEGDAREKS